MNKSSIFAIVIVGLVASLGWGQDAKQPPDVIDVQFLNDLAATRNFMLGRPTSAKPTPDGKHVLFLRSPARQPNNLLYEFDVEQKTTRVLLTPEQLLKGSQEKLTDEEKARRERMRVNVRGFASYQISGDGQRLLFTLSGRLYVFQRDNGDVKELPTGTGPIIDPKFAPNGQSVAYVRGHDVYVIDLKDAKERAVTTGGTADLSHGVAEFVAQEEMDRHSGYWWSPDSKLIAYQESDAREVEIWHVADPFRPGQDPRKQRYPRPGKNNVKVRLGVVSVVEEKAPTTWLKWDVEKYPYLATVQWSEGGPLSVYVQSRSQKEALLLAADVATGQTSTLVEEKDEAWINLNQAMPKWLADGSGFLWTSEREGAWQLELRNPKGELTRVLVPPTVGYVHSHWLQNSVDVDLKRRVVYFLASLNPTEAQVCKVSLDGGPIEKVHPMAGIQGATFSKDFSVYVLRSSNIDRLPTSTVYAADGKAIGDLPSVAQDPPVKPTSEIVKVGDNPGHYCSITRPKTFEKGKKYPVIVEVYGGPGVQVVTANMGSRFKSQWLADQGFIVVTVENRGTPGRGREWERSIKGSFGTIPLEDQVNAVKALAQKHPEIDVDRVGISGWSFGGYMSGLAVMKRPDVFKAGVAGAPVCAWEDYDTHYTERYLGLPKENTAGYTESSLLTYARDLKRPLLLVHGTADDNVYFIHSLKLVDALTRAGQECEVLPMPGFAHGVSDPSVRAKLDQRIVRFFREHLK